MSDARRKLCLQKASADAAHERFARSTEACRSSTTHLRRRSSPWLLRKSSEQGEENEEKPREFTLRKRPRLAAVRQRICEGNLLLGFCGKVPSKARRTRKSRGSLLCVNDRGLPQFDNALRRKSSAKKEHKKTRPYPQATDIVAKSSGFVKCLMQNSPKNSPFARSARSPGGLLQKK